MTGQRPHGRAKYVVEKCRCDECRAAVAAYERNRRRQRAYGREAYIDAEPVRAHVHALGEFGIGWKRVAMLSGVSTATVWKLLYGDRTRGRGEPSKRVRSETAAKILAVEATFDNVADGSIINAVGTRRRLQALVAIGWSHWKLGKRLGSHAKNMTALITAERVQVGTARAVRALYDELWETPPPATEHRDKIAYNRARRFAAERGWPPPLAWDDDEIDDPTAQPAGVAGTEPKQGRPGKLPPADELRQLVQETSRLAVAQRFGVRPDSVYMALRRSA